MNFTIQGGLEPDTQHPPSPVPDSSLTEPPLSPAGFR